jgi:superfamily II DNA helicase RecQ
MAQFNTFFIPVVDNGLGQEELNSFLRSKRVLAVEKAFTGQGWSFCVEWLEGGKPELSGKPRVDYKEVLSREEFALFSRLRDKRKELARRDGVQVYTIMTNEQLAGMVRLNVRDVNGLSRIEGIGESRIKKYGQDLVSVFNNQENVDEKQ